jgi:hypothetical protein
LTEAGSTMIDPLIHSSRFYWILSIFG